MTMPALGWAASAATPKTRHIVVTYAWSYSNIGDVGNAKAIVARRQAETMAVVKQAVERGARPAG